MADGAMEARHATVVPSAAAPKKTRPRPRPEEEAARRARPRSEEESRAPRSGRMAQVEVAESGWRVVVASAAAASGTTPVGREPDLETGRVGKTDLGMSLRVGMIGPPVRKPARGDRRPTEEPS